MMRVAIALAVACIAASTAAAQVPGAAAKRAAKTAVNAPKPVQSGATQQGTAKQGALKQAAAKPVKAPAASTTTPPKAGQPSKPGSALAVGTRGETANVPPLIMREVFVYDAAGRRDPFVSLLTTSELRPALSDLKLTGILYDMSGRRPVATLRDLTDNTQYTVTTGTALGRMRVAAIRPKTVIFSINEFGTNRLDSLVLGDSTKARAR